MVGVSRVGKGLTPKRHGEKCWFCGNIHYLDCGSGGDYKDAYITQNSTNSTLEAGTFYCMQILPQQNF